MGEGMGGSTLARLPVDIRSAFVCLPIGLGATFDRPSTSDRRSIGFCVAFGGSWHAIDLLWRLGAPCDVWLLVDDLR